MVEGFIPPISRPVETGEDLKQLFYRSIDVSAINNLCRQLSHHNENEINVHPDLVGEGRNFVVYKLDSKPQKIVLKIPKFLLDITLRSEAKITNYRIWMKACSRLQECNIVHLAPFKLLRIPYFTPAEVMILVRPLLDLQIQKSEAVTAELKHFESQVKASLKKNQFVIRDYFQFGRFNNQPVLFDISDLIDLK